MKGAIGNAFILNMVITFIIIFYMLLIGGIAYTKAYKVKNYLLDSIVSFEEASGFELFNEVLDFDGTVNDYLAKSGYILNNDDHRCPAGDESYTILRDTGIGKYDYCIYVRNYEITGKSSDYQERKYSFKVISYMKFDFPIVGEFLKIPLSGETRIFTTFKSV